MKPVTLRYHDKNNFLILADFDLNFLKKLKISNDSDDQVRDAASGHHASGSIKLCPTSTQGLITIISNKAPTVFSEINMEELSFKKTLAGHYDAGVVEVANSRSTIVSLDELGNLKVWFVGKMYIGNT